MAVLPFTRQPEGEDVIIGRVETGVFLAVPPEALELLEGLAQGKRVGEVADLYHEKHGESPDLEDFLQFLETKGIVKPAAENGMPAGLPSAAPLPQKQPRYHFSNFSRTTAQSLFSLPVLLGCLGLIALAIVLTALDPLVRTGPRDLFFADHRTLCWTILTLVTYASIYVHEIGHLIAARALGINSRIGISHRLWFVVAETDLTGLWSVPKQQRYMPLLAGTLVDSVSAAVLVLFLSANGHQWFSAPPLVVRLVRATIFTYLMRILWQGFLFIRTDFYYVIASAFNCRNLLSDTENLLRNLAARFIPRVRSVDQSAIPEAERRIIRGYALVWLVGRSGSFMLLIAITIPLAMRYIRDLAGAFNIGYSAAPSNFIDALLLAIYFLVPLIMGLMMWVNSILRRERT